MLQQILKDMYIDPEILEELSEDQKQVLFFKMREEQIRRWNVWQDKIVEEEKLNPSIKRKSAKNVRFYCDDDLNLILDFSTEPDPDDVKKKQEEEVLRKAEEQARKEAEQRRKQLDETEAKYRQELKRKEEEMERLRREMEERKEEEKRRAEEEAIILLEEKNRIKEAERKRQEEEERKREETKRRREEENRIKRELERKAREDALAEEERKRKEEIYQSMKIEQEKTRKLEEEESKRLDEEWKEREVKAKEADIQRKNSFSNSKKEMERIRRLSRERSELQKFRRPDVPTNMYNELLNIPEDIQQTTSMTTTSTTPNFVSSLTMVAKNYSSPPAASSSSKTRSLPVKRPPLPPRADGTSRLTISNPVRVTSTRDEVETRHIKKELTKPSRPPPPPSLLRLEPNIEGTYEKMEVAATAKKDAKPRRPARPKSKDEVVTWYKEVEYVKLSGLDYEKRPMEWFHGVITRQESERLLNNKKQGSYLVRLSERVWGYTISFKDIGRCKHFLIDTAQGGYQFFGMEQIVHDSLNELIEYHKIKHISGLGEELLLYPCGQEKTPPDYEDLFVYK